MTLEPEQPLILGALPLDSKGAAVQGLSAVWESGEPGIVSVRPGGEAVAVRPGRARLTARAGDKRGHVDILVTQGAGEKFGGKKKNSQRADTRAGRLEASAAAVRFVKASHGGPRPKARAAKTSRASSASVTAPALFLRDPNDPLPDTETGTLYEPSNDVGSPPNKTEAGAPAPPAAAAGTETPASDNFSLGVPLVSIPGRGMGVSLALHYNSRVWHQSSSDLVYDVDSGWPAPGFRLGYGQMEDQGIYGFTLTDPDGTRHQMAKRATGPYDYESVDGTFIHFWGGRNWGIVTYTDGTRVQYGAAGAGYRSYPVKVTDPQGNYISIHYVDPDDGGPSGEVGPKISYVEDTMGRRVRFSYDGHDLTSITAPRYAGAGSDETTVVRLYYGTIDFEYGPSNLANLFDPARVSVSAPYNVRVIRYLYFEGTQTGYRYDYSPYAMIRRVVQLRKMQTDSFNLDPLEGAPAGDGQWAASTTYNYPDTPLNWYFAPYYTTKADDWGGRTSAQPVYTFENETGLARVIAPDGSVSETMTINAPGLGSEWKNGLVEETVFKESVNGAVLSRTKIEWQQGAGGGARPLNVWTTDEAGQTRAVVYNDYDSYNNAGSVSERDFAAAGTMGPELRRTETDYVTGAAWTSRRLFRLPAQVRVVTGSTVVARTDFAYDQTALAARGPAAVTGHDQTYNPESGDYDPSTVYRGNVTSVTRYADAANGTGAQVTTAAYDILGNVVEQAVNCCRKKYFTYTGAYHFAYPESETRGDAPLQMRTSATYDFNTGVVRTTRDENDQESTFHYHPNTLRLTQALGPDDRRTDFYEETELLSGPGGAPRYSYALTTTSFEAGRSVDSYRFFDGRGALVRTFTPYTAAQG